MRGRRNAPRRRRSVLSPNQASTPPTPEAVLDKLLVRECKKRGVACLRITGTVGVPDRLIVASGWHLWVELKTSTGRLTAAQRAIHSKLRRAGAHVIVARGRAGVSDVLAAIDELLAGT